MKQFARTLALTSALALPGCASKNVTLNDYLPTALTGSKTAAPEAATSLDTTEKTLYVHIPGLKTYLSTLTTDREITLKAAVCANLGLTSNQKVGEAMVALDRIDANHNRFTDTDKKCRLAGATPLRPANDTQASSSQVFTSEPTL
jgi:hypothetical protein